MSIAQVIVQPSKSLLRHMLKYLGGSMRIGIALFLLFQIIYSQTNDRPVKQYFPVKINQSAIQIDGILDDDAWQTVPEAEDFVQFNPVEGALPSEQTRFKVAYDESNIYIAVQAQDSDPSAIVSRVTRRDDIDDSDFIFIAIDSYFDHRTAFGFGLSAGGVKTDVLFSEDGSREDESWDPVWYGKTTIGRDGWIAEMRIPYNQLRFADKEVHIWGFNVFRKIHRRQEEIFWQLIPKSAAGMVSFFGELAGLREIKPASRIEILPYSVAKINTYQQEQDNPYLKGTDRSLSGGIDGKIGLTGNLTMDFTVNPDFGQVEADPSEVNLTAFETFFDEKRPFFIEGKNIFEFRLGIGDGGFASEQLFYSRRIGRQPHYYPDEADGFNHDFASVPEYTHILGAAKLSGKTESGWSVGVLDAVTDEERASISLDGNKKSLIVEPLTNYLITRLQKDFNRGNTSIGGMFTSTNRRINADHLTFLNRSAMTGGIDLRHQWSDKAYLADLRLAFSRIDGHKDAISELQTASARYFQRPDARHLNFDPERTTLSGNGGTFNIGKVGGKFQYLSGTIWRSPGFELNDAGYLRKADQIMNFIWVGYNDQDKKGILNRFRTNFNYWNVWDYSGDKLSSGGNVNSNLQFINFWGVFGGFNREAAGISTTALRGGPALQVDGTWNYWYGLYSDQRKSVNFELEAFSSVSDDGYSQNDNYELSLNFKPGSRLGISLDPFYSKNRDNLQYVDETEYLGQSRYLFARLKQETIGFVLRLNYSYTPELSVQYYGQPFISSGGYSLYKRITNPKAEKLSDRFTGIDQTLSYDADEELYNVDENEDGMDDYSFGRPDFDFMQFRSNLVVRWEYLPGSLIYLVWSQGRNEFENNGRLRFNKNITSLFDTHPENIFLIKFNYWFSI